MATNEAMSTTHATPEATVRPQAGPTAGGQQQSHVQLKRQVAATEGYDAQMALLAPGHGGGGGGTGGGASAKAPGSGMAGNSPVQKQDGGQSKGWLESIADFFGYGSQQDEETEATDPELEAFLNTNLFGPKDLQAPSGLGGFSATYDASSGQLAIEVRGSVAFTDGLVDQGGVVTANHPDLQTAADAANTIPDPADRALFMADFLWAGADTGAWLTQMQTNVQNAWSCQYAFFVDKPGWEKVVADVSMAANIRAGAAQGTDHVGVTVYKVPDDGSWDVGAVVNSNSNTPYGHGMVLGSRDNRNAEQRDADGEGGLLNWSISEFASGSALLTPDMQAQVTTFCNNFIDAGNDNSNPITITGRASSDGAKADNERLASARAEAVAEALKAGGVTAVRLTTEVAGEDGATADSEWRRVDLKVGDGRAQDVAAHEFGHVLGLGDYYDDAGNGRGGSITGTGQPAGTVTMHDQCAKDIGIAGGAVHENNDGLMSLGTNVKPADYATIGWALQDVTGRREWRIRQ